MWRLAVSAELVSKVTDAVMTRSRSGSQEVYAIVYFDAVPATKGWCATKRCTWRSG